jgi:lipopolysaccharide kinase (Kdo/WaaP) family protein
MVEIRARLAAGPAGPAPLRRRGSESWTRASGEAGLQIWLRAPLGLADAEVLARCARDAGEWQALPKVGEARRSSVARLRLSAGPVVVKRYSEPGAFRLLTFAKRSRAEREARALDLVGAVLPEHTVRALAWLEERSFGFVARSWLVTAELEQSFDLRRIKLLEGAERAAAIRPVLAELPWLVARLHAQRVFAATLRGKNVLLQPATGRIALIDLPYARTVARFGPRHRVRDLAILSLELRRFLDGESWNAFLARYRAAAAELGAADVDGIDEPRVAHVAAREGHQTWSSARRKWLKRRFRHSRVGEWVTGHRYSRN